MIYMLCFLFLKLLKINIILMSKSFLDTYSELLDPELSPIRSKTVFLPSNIVINIQKLGALFFMFSMMVYYNNFSKGCWVYLGLHGSYGIVWVLKDITFPDKGFQKKMGLIELVVLILILALYYTMGFLMVSGRANNDPSNERVFCCIMMYVIGIVMMISTDVQKYVRLSLKKGLIDDLAVAYNRNTNFFGEMLLYWSFATLTNEYLGYLVLIIVWSTVFVSRIWIKERSLRKKDGYKQYAEKSYLLIFKFFSSDLLNALFYTSSFLIGYLIYSNGGIESTVKIIRGI